MKKNIRFIFTTVGFMFLSFSPLGFAQNASEQKSDVDTATFSESDNTESTSSQEYIIRQGDTMWDICKIVLDNPWYWPKLWSINKYILNPNLIYPSNRLFFSPGSGTSFPKMGVVQDGETVDEYTNFEEKTAMEAKPVVEEGNTGFTIDTSLLKKGESLALKLRSITLVTKEDMKTVGHIGSSVEPKAHLTFGDKLYLKFNKKMEVNLGDKFQVIERIKMVFDPDRETKKIGTLIKKKAVVTVSHIYAGKNWRNTVVEATVADGDDSVSRGDEVVVYKSNVRSVVPHFTDREISGKIVEADTEQFLISNNDFIFLNIGTKAGLQPGLQMYVVRHGDGLVDDDDSGLPDIPVAKILIVDSTATTSTAYVTTLDRALSVGDRVRSKIE